MFTAYSGISILLALPQIVFHPEAKTTLKTMLEGSCLSQNRDLPTLASPGMPPADPFSFWPPPPLVHVARGPPSEPVGSRVPGRSPGLRGLPSPPAGRGLPCLSAPSNTGAHVHASPSYPSASFSSLDICKLYVSSNFLLSIIEAPLGWVQGLFYSVSVTFGKINY